MTRSAASEQILPLTVVIATLGGEVLKDTVARLNQGYGIPTEILICIPEDCAADADWVSDVANVEIIKTACRGQVAQRAIGLSRASQPYVMQLDDDVILLPDTVRTVFSAVLTKGPGHVAAPFFRIWPSGEDGTRYIGGLPGFLRNCHASLVCGSPFGRKRMGRITSAGTGFGVPMENGPDRVVESEWLPGGVVICHRQDVIAENYYPFPGKAYSEDLIHSVLWRQRGCRLWTVLDAFAMIDVTVESLSWKSLMARFRAHAYVAKLSGGSIWHTRAWFVVHCLANARGLLRANAGVAR